MKLEFKPDFEEARQRWTDFWEGKNKRPLVNIVIPKEGMEPVDPPAYLAGSDGKFEPVIDQLLAWGETHEFIGEAIPFYMLEFGPDTFASYLGADLKFLPDHPDTSWSVPFVEDWDDVEIKFRRDSIWWKRTVEFIKAIRARCDGKLLIAPPSLNANLDVLSAIRGTENLLSDLVLCPEKVKNALEGVCRVHTEVLQAYSELLSFDIYGSINLEGFFTEGRQSRPQSDVSCMIGPDMFREFVLPCLKSEAADVDAMVYHLDGPDAIKHLDVLCEIEGLDLITWVPGVANKDKDWSWLYKRIVALGKGFGRFTRNHEEIKRSLKEFNYRKLSYTTTASSKTEAEDLIAELDRLYS